MRKLIDDEKLTAIRDACLTPPTSSELKNKIKAELGIDIDEATIRGRFIAMGKPLSGVETIAIDPNEWKPGTKLLIKQNLSDVPDGPGLNADMKKLEGTVVEYDCLDNHGWVRVKGNRFTWIKEWFSDDAKEIDKVLNPLDTTSFKKTITIKKFNIPQHLQVYVPDKTEFDSYVVRDVDSRLAHHLDLGKYPICQGKQGTGKTYSYAYYAFQRQLPFLLLSAYEDFKLAKLFGDKTIINGSVVFQEALFVELLQSPSLICIDECNAISQANTYDWHALLQNRQLFVKDADNGKGKIYRVHPDCRIGFAQNPKSAKYIGGNVRSSNFLGRCTYITFPEFSLAQLRKAILAKHPTLPKDLADKFIKFYQGCSRALEESQLPIDISIRQLNNVIDLYIHGMDLKDACEDGLASITEAASQPKAKEALMTIAVAVWEELMSKKLV